MGKYAIEGGIFTLMHNFHDKTAPLDFCDFPQPQVSHGYNTGDFSSLY